jgi:hypothetical protein
MGRVKIQFCSFLTSALEEGESLASYPGRFTAGERHGWEAQWAAEPVWTLRRQTNLWPLPGIEFGSSDFTARSLVIIPNFNPLKAELNSICHLLALLGAHHILHISRIRVNDCSLKSLNVHERKIYNRHHIKMI